MANISTVFLYTGQANGQAQKAVLCKNGGDYFTISCGQSSSHFPAFINIVTVPRLIYSERLRYMSGIENCPSEESEIVATCQSETTTPISRLELSHTCYATIITGCNHYSVKKNSKQEKSNCQTHGDTKT